MLQYETIYGQEQRYKSVPCFSSHTTHSKGLFTIIKTWLLDGLQKTVPPRPWVRFWYCSPAPLKWKRLNCNTRNKPTDRGGAISRRKQPCFCFFLILDNLFNSYGGRKSSIRDLWQHWKILWTKLVLSKMMKPLSLLLLSVQVNPFLGYCDNSPWPPQKHKGEK